MSETATLRVDTHLDPADLGTALRTDARRGLTATPKDLPPKWFYDDRGSELFDEITRLPEYYPTRTERSILLAHAGDIVAASGAAARVAAEYPGVDVHAVVGDFERHLAHVPDTGRRTVAFLGGTIGNFSPEPRAQFLAALAATLYPGETLLLGTDLVKDEGRLVRAYDDGAGVTAAFNKNVLHVLNRELGATFDPDAFDHVACWNAADEWIEMRLRARGALQVAVPALDLDVRFDAGEEMRTEISAKFRRDRVAEELATAGFELAEWWTDPADDFALSLARRAEIV